MISFFDRLFGRRKINREYTHTDEKEKAVGNMSYPDSTLENDEEYEVKSQSVNGKLSICGKTPKIIGEWEACGNKYLISHFDMKFMQEVDKKNHPDSMVYGGFMTIVLVDSVPDVIREWITDRNKKHDGKIRFYVNEESFSGNSIVSLSFEDAYCTQYKRNVDLFEDIDLTTL